MKRKTLITFAAALLPLAGFVEEKPLWVVQGRLDGAKNPRLNGLLKELFAKDGSDAFIGDKTVCRIAGISFLAWRDGDSLLRLAGPPRIAGVNVAPAATLQGDPKPR